MNKEFNKKNKGYSVCKKLKTNKGILTRNQWRQQENMNEVEDEYGDDYFCSQQIRPIKKVYEDKKQ